MSSTKSKLMRWALLLADFDFDVTHVPGTNNQAADSLSRNPAYDHDSDKSLPEREVPRIVQKSEEEPVLMRMGKDITADLLKKCQAEDPACKAMMT